MTGRGLTAWREGQGLTTFELAKMMKMDVGAIINWEKQTAGKLPVFLEVTLRAIERMHNEEKAKQSDS